ncbi:hypothetical protein MTBBW1_1720009 [Desulfamplus magnetovallimortis]|uniref:Uncharacterized protein n=1 Tax=Desulfamplus magnetovallimortis TaxID=1246637 RepID=A0A1W1H9T7_9BACT|nr:hypothetical protein MTBBW1_1720009 [Desulfamplus magnetovallimortis]
MKYGDFLINPKRDIGQGILDKVSYIQYITSNLNNIEQYITFPVFLILATAYNDSNKERLPQRIQY